MLHYGNSLAWNEKAMENIFMEASETLVWSLESKETYVHDNWVNRRTDTKWYIIWDMAEKMKQSLVFRVLHGQASLETSFEYPQWALWKHLKIPFFQSNFKFWMNLWQFFHSPSSDANAFPGLRMIKHLHFQFFPSRLVLIPHSKIVLDKLDRYYKFQLSFEPAWTPNSLKFTRQTMPTLQLVISSNQILYLLFLFPSNRWGYF